ncbi:MAG TPA: hypothetical protein VFO74_06030 [Pseudolabrys sp.]|nr:hypothetical protein [Pseudolabrys sp.]
MYLAAALGLALAAGWWARRETGVTPNPLANASFQRLTSFDGSELDAAVSPDGRFVVFVSNREGPYDVWVTQVGTGAFTNLTKGTVPYILIDAIRNVG